MTQFLTFKWRQVELLFTADEWLSSRKIDHIDDYHIDNYCIRWLLAAAAAAAQNVTHNFFPAALPYKSDIIRSRWILHLVSETKIIVYECDKRHENLNVKIIRKFDVEFIEDVIDEINFCPLLNGLWSNVEFSQVLAGRVSASVKRNRVGCRKHSMKWRDALAVIGKVLW